MTDGRQLASAHLAAEQRRVRRAEIAAIAESESAGTFQAVGILSLFAMAGRDDEAILVIRDGEIAMHLLDLRDREAGLGKNAPPVAVTKLALTEIDSHREHALERGDDRSLGAGGQKIGEIANRDAQRANVRYLAHAL